MDEYVKCDDALRALEQINPVDYGAMRNYDAHHYVRECLRDCKEALYELPAADVEMVTRCKDCKHLYGTLCTVCGLLPRKQDDFCSYGEPKEG